MNPEARHPTRYKLDARRKHGPQYLRQKTTIHEPARAFDQRIGRESPYRAAHTFPATIRQQTLTVFARRRAASSHKYWHGTEVRSAYNDDHDHALEEKPRV